MKNSKWLSAKNLFDFEEIEGQIIFRRAKTGSLLCHNVETDNLFLCQTGFPPCKFNFNEAIDWAAGTGDQYEYKIVS